MYKKYIAIIAAVVVVIAGTGWYYEYWKSVALDEKADTQEQMQIRQSCIDSWHSKQIEYVSGKVIVGFLEKTTKDEINDIFDEYNLKGKIESYVENLGIALVSVPEGQEFNWICRLSEDTRIKNIEPDYAVKSLISQ